MAGGVPSKTTAVQWQNTGSVPPLPPPAACPSQCQPVPACPHAWLALAASLAGSALTSSGSESAHRNVPRPFLLGCRRCSAASGRKYFSKRRQCPAQRALAACRPQQAPAPASHKVCGSKQAGGASGWRRLHTPPAATAAAAGAGAATTHAGLRVCNACAPAITSAPLHCFVMLQELSLSSQSRSHHLHCRCSKGHSLHGKARRQQSSRRRRRQQLQPPSSRRSAGSTASLQQRLSGAARRPGASQAQAAAAA